MVGSEFSINIMKTRNLPWINSSVCCDVRGIFYACGHATVSMPNLIWSAGVLYSPLSTSQVFMYYCCTSLNLSSHFHNACSPPNSSSRELRLPEPVSETTCPELNIIFTHSGPLSMKWVSFKGHSQPKRCCWPCPSLYDHCVPILW